MQDVMIIGGGIAGMTAAIYAVRSGLSTLLLERMDCGGQIGQAATVENYPGFEQITGLALAEKVEQQVRACGAVIQYEEVLEICSDKTVKTAANVYPAGAVIVANGVARRKLHVPGEETFLGRGVSYCGHCDGQLFRDKAVAVVGGGNTAVQEALHLARLCSQVHFIHRRGQLTAQARLQAQLLLQSNVQLHLHTQVTEICGDDQVQAIRLSGTGEDMLEVDGIFIAVGYQPENALVSGLGVLDDDGYIITDERCATAVPWLFAAGDTRRKQLRQLVTAASDGAVAAAQVANYLHQ